MNKPRTFREKWPIWLFIALPWIILVVTHYWWKFGPQADHPIMRLGLPVVFVVWVVVAVIRDWRRLPH